MTGIEHVDVLIVGEGNSGSPQVRRIDAVADALHVDSASGHRFVDLDQLFDTLADAVAATGATAIIALTKASQATRCGPRAPGRGGSAWESNPPNPTESGRISFED